MNQFLFHAARLACFVACLALFACANDPLIKLLMSQDSDFEQANDSLVRQPKIKNVKAKINNNFSEDGQEYAYQRVQRNNFRQSIVDAAFVPTQENIKIAFRANTSSPTKMSAFEQLQRGMATISVRQILGEPTYVDIISAPQFGNERWSYVEEQNNKKEYKVLFDHGKLSAWWYH